MPAHPQHPHLPEGRDPGPQSRRRRGGRRIAAVLYLVSYAWRVVAREPVGMRADRATDEPIWVRP